ncbi:ShlB/FhaC/HecB family hemolysin secretion/activation protein [Variovorax sp. LARHSF232]
MAVGAFCASIGAAFAQGNPTAPRPFVEEQRQLERERALRQQQEPPVDARLPSLGPAPIERLPGDESPCFRIDRLVLAGERSDAFQWLLDEAAGADGLNDSPVGRCLGTRSVNIVLARAQQALVAKGWVTSRLLAAPQDLSAGVLILTLVPGRIAAIRFADSARATTSLRTAIPAQVGDLLNLRDIEQGLENLKRLPTAEADIQIEPSSGANAQPGDSDLVVKYARQFPLRTTLSIDDSGTEATGKNQAGVTVAWDGPLGLNDLAYVSLNHDAFNHSGQGTRGYTAHYSVPYGDWLFAATASASSYYQTVAGYDQDYVYSGESGNLELKASRMLTRGAAYKTGAWLGAFQRTASNAINDTEIENQRRRVSGWMLGLNHRQFIGQATVDATLGYRQGTGAFGALHAPEEEFGEGTARMRLFTADVSLNAPFEIAGQRLRYSGLWRAQWNRTPLTPQDRFSIGGRYTVRGFDGELSLMGERGWLVRNDIGWALAQTGAELYAGVDHGEVGGFSTAFQVGTRLTGGVIGVRGAWRGLNYDGFVGAPIRMPEGFRTANVTAGFNLNYSF